MENSLGSLIKAARKTAHLSQKQACHNICSQPMISAIEHDRYTPNAQLLFALCDRLQLNLQDLSLATNYGISDNQQLNQSLKRLCDQHQYQELANFLTQSTTINQVGTVIQEQSYYYYLGVAQVNTQQLDAGLQSLKLALAELQPTTNPTTLTRLCHIALAYTYSCKYNWQLMKHYQKLAWQNFDSALYEENLNIVSYLTALMTYNQADYVKASQQLTQAITFITQHNSHYMLMNCYYLLAQSAEHLDQKNQAQEARLRQDILAEWFPEDLHHVN